MNLMHLKHFLVLYNLNTESFAPVTSKTGFACRVFDLCGSGAAGA